MKFFILLIILISTAYSTPCRSADPDTIRIGNNALSGSGGHIMTDQYPAIVISPSNSKLYSISIYISSVARTDSLRLITKSNPSWGCSGIGGMSHPFTSDQYTLGFSKNTLVTPNSWNEFYFDPPLTTSDTIYVWPDLLQMIQPRIEFAAGDFEDSLLYANCVFSSLAQNDYRCEFTFLEEPPCADIEYIADDQSNNIMSDTISSTAIIGDTRSIIYEATAEVRFLHPFEVILGGILEVNMKACNE